MNKSELVEVVAAKAKVTKKRAEDAVSLIFDSMTNAMVGGERIEIRGLGSFMVKEYASYTGRNPRTGESIEVKPKRLPFFKVGKELKERVDGVQPEKPTEASFAPASGFGGNDDSTDF